MQLSEPSVQERRKRAKWRAWHRGMKELDLVLGHFADEFVDTMAVEELGRFEDLLHVEDVDLYAWLVRRVPVPVECDNALLRRVLTYRVTG